MGEQQGMAMAICHPDCPRTVEKVARLVHHQINSAGNTRFVYRVDQKL
ncbi:hypothetical protein [Ectobacillus funiculus]|nr:hypothetical protein [Ectobacillus funiculus]